MERRQTLARGDNPQTLQVWATTALEDTLYLAADSVEAARTTLFAYADLAEARPEFVEQALGAIARQFQEQPEEFRQRPVEQQQRPVERQPIPIYTPRPSQGDSRVVGSPPRNGPFGGTNTEFTGTEQTPERLQRGDKEIVDAFRTALAEEREEARRADAAPPRDGTIGAGPATGGADPPNSEERINDKLNALTGLEYKQTLPVIKDTDPDWDKRYRQFKSIIDCHAFGRRGVRPYDVILLLRKTLPSTGPRIRVYNTVIEQAQLAGRLPQEAAAVLETLELRLRQVIRETPFQKQDRLDKEFEKLEMGRSSHADFQTLFEEKVMLMEQAGLSIATSEEDLKRKHLSKLLRTCDV